ncbi:fungal-specific transcription factor domain-containing protein, partial [Vararia minispora EC-137]
ACDQCRKTKSKCERFEGDVEPCKSCAAAGVPCTFLGPSFKRGPPKGYIHAIEQRWHQVESVLGAILASPDPQVAQLINNLKRDDLARDILNRVDVGPFGPTGRLNHSVAVNKEDFFASILNGAEAQPSRDPSRPRRQSRMSREIVSSSEHQAHNSMLVNPTLEWQDRLSTGFARVGSIAGCFGRTTDGQPLAQRRRLDSDGPDGTPDWDRMYKLDGNPSGTSRSEEAANGLGQLSLDENRELRYHGFASGLHLLTKANLQRRDQRNAGGIWNLPMARVWPPAANQFIPEESVDVEMPSLSVQRHLLELYFTYVHPQFPIIHKSMFWRDFEALQSNGTSKVEKPHISRLLVLSMLAISARYDNDIEDPPPGTIWEAGLDYMVRAREVLNRVYHYCRPATCQALVLLGMREFGIGLYQLWSPRQLGTAMDLGLHRDASTWQTNGRTLFSPMELQARKQIWWACQKADNPLLSSTTLCRRYSAVYMGRPPAINEANYDTRLPEVDEDETWQPHSSDPLSMDFTPVPGRVMLCFLEGSKLIAMLGSILDRIYPIRPVAQVVKRQALTELEAQLDKWYAELPDVLAFDVASARYIPPPHILLLHVKYWNCVLLLHRAFIPKWRPEAHRRSSHSQDSTAQKSFDICQSAATHMTNIIVAMQSTYSLARSTMLIVQHLFAAGIMHIVTLTMRPSNVQTLVALQRVLGALKEMSVRWPAAQRAWELVHGAQTHIDNGFPQYPVGSSRQPKRPAEDAFGLSEKVSDILQQEAFEERSRTHVPQSEVAQPRPTGSPNLASADTTNRVLAHMLGLDIPGIEPSTSYLPGYQWWPR